MAESGVSKNKACIVNCVKKEGIQIVSSLIEELTDKKLSTQQVESSPQQPLSWTVDNKYYSAQIELFVVTSDEPSWGGVLVKDCQAIVFLCDLDQHETLESLKLLWARVKEGDSPDEGATPDICVVMGLSTDSTSSSDVLQWCVEEGLELIEWERGGNPRPQDTDSDDGFPPEAVGVARLSETLQAHMWPSITMKNRDLTTSDRRRDDPSTTLEPTSETVASDAGLEVLESKVTTTGSKEESRERIDGLLLTEEQLSSALKDEDPGGENFEDLFSRFAQMKQHAESLPHEDRKAYAEKVAMAFWNAIGGDDDEVS